eukprot:10685883-Heterocapsa_arctica.AAC.1
MGGERRWVASSHSGRICSMQSSAWNATGVGAMVSPGSAIAAEARHIHGSVKPPGSVEPAGSAWICSKGCSTHSP